VLEDVSLLCSLSVTSCLPGTTRHGIDVMDVFMFPPKDGCIGMSVSRFNCIYTDMV
jgi:hypothetical protein